jgi:hypothetical protein
MANYYNVPVEQIKQSLAGQQGGEANIANNLRTRKAVEAIVGHAKITDGEWIDESQKPAEAAIEEEKPKGKSKKVKAESPESTEKEEKPKKKTAKKDK